MLSYLKNRIDTGDSFKEVAESFYIEPPWLQNWIDENSESSNLKSGQVTLENISVEDFSVLLEAWVSNRRELADGEALCSAAIRGDVAQLKQLLATDIAWDAEDRFGITAGEYAIYFQQGEALEVLMTKGAQEVTNQMKRQCEAAQETQSLSVSTNNKLGCEEKMTDKEPTRKSWGYLKGSANYKDGSLIDQQGMPVMMPWEASLMESHALEMKGMQHVINIGFGCGYVDSFIQKLVRPKVHTIIEAHPDVIKNIEDSGWSQKAGVRIRQGRWQEVMPLLVAEARTSTAEGSCVNVAEGAEERNANEESLDAVFDSIFYDTHDEGVVEFLGVARSSASLLRANQKHGKEVKQKTFSFWNGMEFHNAYRHTVYCRALQYFLTLPEGGNYAQVSFKRLPVNLSSKDWQGWESKGLRYWHLNSYYLPTCYVHESDTVPQSLISPCGEDLADWMIEGIRKGALYHGFEEQVPKNLDTERRKRIKSKR